MHNSIWFLRHAQSTFNQNRTGAQDCNISDNGKIQASEIKGVFDLIILSPLRRTHQTLLYSNILANKIIISNNIREFKQSLPDFLEGEEIIFETENELNERTKNFKEELEIYKQKFEKILIISHRYFIHNFTGILPNNCQLVEYK